MLQNSSPKDSSQHVLPIGKRIGYMVLIPAWVFVVFVVVQLLVSFAVQGLVAAGVPLDQLNAAILGVLFSAVVYALTIAIVIGAPLLILKRKTSLQLIGLHRLTTWKDLGIAPLGLIVYFLLSFTLIAIAQATLTFVDFDQQQVTGFEGLSERYEYALAFIALVVFAPIAEEVLFRGYIFGKLRKVVPVWISILITSLLFAIVHFAWNVGIDVFALSIVLCLVTLWSKSLWPAIMIHMTKNFIAYFFLFINPVLLSTIGG